MPLKLLWSLNKLDFEFLEIKYLALIFQSHTVIFPGPNTVPYMIGSQ